MPATLISIHPQDDPENPPNAAEQMCAEALMKLGDGFVIRWGFYYSTNHGAIQGEGDFLVLGPDGNVLHIEVKGGRCEFNPTTKKWATSDGADPLNQRNMIWNQVTKTLNQADRGKRHVPFVGHMLGLPEVEISNDVWSYQNMPRKAILDQTDLAKIADWWEVHFRLHKYKNVEERRALFLKVFAPHLQPGVSKHILTFTERQLERHTAARYDLLDALAQNEQFLFRGGPGTGKTWFALEQAFRWAKGGKRVLFLTFNLALADMLRNLVAHKKITGVEVYSYEALAKRLYELIGEDFPQINDQDRAPAKLFYESEMPAKLCEIVGALDEGHLFDALVVDEAQDHDTSFHPEPNAEAKTPGWWEIYVGLLKQRERAPVALFYDKFQRHHGRELGKFDPKILQSLFPKLVSVRLQRTMRYTQQILDFLKKIDHAEIKELLLDMDQAFSLPDGKEPQVIPTKNAIYEEKAVNLLIHNWCLNGECRPEDVLILYPTSKCRPKWLDQEKWHGFPIAPNGQTGGIRWSSVHKAKGLESQAVILVGFPPQSKVFGESAAKGLPFTWFMGASRAKQLLAIIERSDLNEATVETM